MGEDVRQALRLNMTFLDGAMPSWLGGAVSGGSADGRSSPTVPPVPASWGISPPPAAAYPLPPPPGPCARVPLFQAPQLPPPFLTTMVAPPAPGPCGALQHGSGLPPGERTVPLHHVRPPLPGVPKTQREACRASAPIVAAQQGVHDQFLSFPASLGIPPPPAAAYPLPPPPGPCACVPLLQSPQFPPPFLATMVAPPAPRPCGALQRSAPHSGLTTGDVADDRNRAAACGYREGACSAPTIVAHHARPPPPRVPEVQREVRRAGAPVVAAQQCERDQPVAGWRSRAVSPPAPPQGRQGFDGSRTGSQSRHRSQHRRQGRRQDRSASRRRLRTRRDRRQSRVNSRHSPRGRPNGSRGTVARRRRRRSRPPLSPSASRDPSLGRGIAPAQVAPVTSSVEHRIISVASPPRAPAPTEEERAPSTESPTVEAPSPVQRDDEHRAVVSRVSLSTSPSPPREETAVVRATVTATQAAPVPGFYLVGFSRCDAHSLENVLNILRAWSPRLASLQSVTFRPQSGRRGGAAALLMHNEFADAATCLAILRELGANNNRQQRRGLRIMSPQGPVRVELTAAQRRRLRDIPGATARDGDGVSCPRPPCITDPRSPLAMRWNSHQPPAVLYSPTNSEMFVPVLRLAGGMMEPDAACSWRGQLDDVGLTRVVVALGQGNFVDPWHVHGLAAAFAGSGRRLRDNAGAGAFAAAARASGDSAVSLRWSIEQCQDLDGYIGDLMQEALLTAFGGEGLAARIAAFADSMRRAPGHSHINPSEPSSTPARLLRASAKSTAGGGGRGRGGAPSSAQTAHRTAARTVLRRSGSGSATPYAPLDVPPEVSRAVRGRCLGFSQRGGDPAAGNPCVCLEDFGVGDNALRLPCMHVFHRQCVERWFTADVRTDFHPGGFTTTYRMRCPFCYVSVLEM